MFEEFSVNSVEKDELARAQSVGSDNTPREVSNFPSVVESKEVDDGNFS